MAPLRDISLADFIQKYTDMCNDEWYEEQDRNLVNFALCGVDYQDEEARIRLNITQNHRLRPNGAIPTLSRDYDSVIGFTERIPIKRDLYIYCLPPMHISTIYAKMHVQVKFHTPKVCSSSTVGFQAARHVFKSIFTFLLYFFRVFNF